MGKPGFPTPRPGKARAQPLRRGVGKPGFPTPPTRWEGLGGRSPCLEAGRGRGRVPRPYAAGPGVSRPEVPGAHPS